jgi:hypothetical protein
MLLSIPLVMRLGHILVTYITGTRTAEGGSGDEERRGIYFQSALRQEVVMTLDPRLDTCWTQVR